MLAAMMEHPRLRNCRVAEHYGLQRAQSRLDADWLTLAEYVDSSGSDGWPVYERYGIPGRGFRIACLFPTRAKRPHSTRDRLAFSFGLGWKAGSGTGTAASRNGPLWASLSKGLVSVVRKSPLVFPMASWRIRRYVVEDTITASDMAALKATFHAAD